MESLIQIRTPAPRDWKVSPTQISMFDESQDGGCQRKWGFRYIDGIKPPDLQSAILGKNVHKELETFFLGGEINYKERPGKLAGKILEHLPVAVELRNRFGALEYIEHNHVLWLDGIFYNFVIDLMYPEPDMLVVSDHKTSRDPEAFGCTSESLRSDPQGIIYSFFPLELYNLPVVRLQWTYVRTQAPKCLGPQSLRDAFPIRVEITREEARDKIVRIHKVAQQIVHAKETCKKASELPPNILSCGAFGGCKHAEYCTLSPEQKLRSIFGTETRKANQMGLKEKLQQKRMAPPRPEQLQSWTPTQINSPEAPSPEVARAVSADISQFKGSREKTKEHALQVATAVHGASTSEEAEERIQDMRASMNLNFNPSENPSQSELLARVKAGITNWISVRNQATPQVPFVHGKTLNTAKEQGVLDFTRSGQAYTIWLTGGQQATQGPTQYQPSPTAMQNTAGDPGKEWQGAAWAAGPLNGNKAPEVPTQQESCYAPLNLQMFSAYYVQLLVAGLSSGLINVDAVIANADEAIDALLERLS